MGKTQSTDNIDQILYNYISGVEDKILDAIPDNEEIEYQFSDEFEQKMQTMIRRERLKRKYGVPIKTWRRVAAIFLIVLTGFLVPTMSVDAVREKVFGYIRNVYDTYVSTHYFFWEEPTEEFEPLYPAYLPDGYELVVEETNEDYLMLGYETEDEKVITIYQQMILDEMEAQTDNEFENQESFEVQEVTGTIGYRKDGIISVYWDKGVNRYVVTATNLTKDELIKVAESMK